VQHQLWPARTGQGCHKGQGPWHIRLFECIRKGPATGSQVKLIDELPAPPAAPRLRGVVERELRGGRRREVRSA